MFLHLKDAPPLCGAKAPHADAGLHGLAMKVWQPAGILGSRAIHHRHLSPSAQAQKSAPFRSHAAIGKQDYR